VPHDVAASDAIAGLVTVSGPHGNELVVLKATEALRSPWWQGGKVWLVSSEANKG
jgi:hypothetical protein